MVIYRLPLCRWQSWDHSSLFKRKALNLIYVLCQQWELTFDHTLSEYCINGTALQIMEKNDCVVVLNRGDLKSIIADISAAILNCEKTKYTENIACNTSNCRNFQW